MIGHTFHGSHVKIRGPNETETEIERNQRIHRSDRKRSITIQWKRHIRITGRLANKEHQWLLSTNNDLHRGEHFYPFRVIGDNTHLFSVLLVCIRLRLHLVKRLHQELRIFLWSRGVEEKRPFGGQHPFGSFGACSEGMIIKGDQVRSRKDALMLHHKRERKGNLFRR